MSAKAIREYHAKKLVSKWIDTYAGEVKYNIEERVVLIAAESLTSYSSTLTKITDENPWLLTQPLVAKPDQLIKRRGHAGKALDIGQHIRLGGNLVGVDQKRREKGLQAIVLV